VTDRRTDGIAMAYTRYSIYAVARKNGSLYTTFFMFMAIITLLSVKAINSVTA